MPLPSAAGAVALGVVALGAVAPGAAFCSGAVPGVVCPDASGVAGEVPGVCGVVLGVCGAVLGAGVPGVEVCEFAPAGLLWVVSPEAEPAGDVLFGDEVWAATQTAESSNIENNGAFNLMAVHPSEFCFSHIENVGLTRRAGNPVESLRGWRLSRTANFPSVCKNYRRELPV